MKALYIYNNAIIAVTFIALFICLMKICYIMSKDKEKDTDKPVIVIVSCVSLMLVAIIVAVTVASNIGYSTLKDRVKDEYHGAHNFKSVEKNVSSFEDENGKRHFFEYDPDKNEVIIYQKSETVIKNAL